MRKYLVTLLALAIAGCGFDTPDVRRATTQPSSTTGDTGTTGNTGTGTVIGTVPSGGGIAPVAFVTDGTTKTGKIVLYKQFVGTRAITVGGGSNVPCKVAAPANPNTTPPTPAVIDFCPSVEAGATCVPSTPGATTGLCTNTYVSTGTPQAWDLVYVKNQAYDAVAANNHINDPAPVPCDGGSYQLRLYGSSDLKTGGTITEWKGSSSFVMASPCPTTPPTPTFTASSPVAPTLTIPSGILSGLPAGFGQFTVAVSPVPTTVPPYPWSSMSSITASAATLVDTTTFSSPTATTFSVTGLFPLDSSLLVGTDDPAAWTLQIVNNAGTATASGGVGVN